MKAVLEYKAVTVAYGGRTAAEDVSFVLHEGEALCLAGASGSGKSSLLRAAAGLLPPGGAVTGGSLCLEGRPLETLEETEWQRLRGSAIGLVFQNTGASFCPVRTIGSQIREALSVRGTVTEEEARRRTVPLLEALGLVDGERVWRSYPHELSGGMQQRAALAAALVLSPRVLLADEATSALDGAARQAVLRVFRRFREETGGAVLFTTHDRRTAEEADRVLVLRRGRLVREGTAAEVFPSGGPVVHTEGRRRG